MGPHSGGTHRPRHLIPCSASSVSLSAPRQPQAGPWVEAARVFWEKRRGVPHPPPVVLVLLALPPAPWEGADKTLSFPSEQ